jgi:hypothetical protein
MKLLASGLLVAAVLGVGLSRQSAAEETALKIATFDLDVTPPVGSQMAYDPVRRQDDLPLRCRGIVILGADQPIVLCAVDWIGIANGAHDAFRETLAKAAGTTSERVAVHTLHQHDAPACDFTAERLLKEAGAESAGRYDGGFVREVLGRLGPAVTAALAKAEPVTHGGWGVAEVREVASNRRILGPDGKVRVTRYTATADPAVRAEPEGVIDPQVSLLSFWNGDKPVAVLSYYACHPQSYYRTGVPSPDFPGIARFMRGQGVPTALHVHFNGAGGNIGAGKYNDGAKENRLVLALRLADGMKRAWEATEKFAVTPQDITWRTEPVRIPPGKHLQEERLLTDLKSPMPAVSMAGAEKLAYLSRWKAEKPIDLCLLSVASVRVLHMPGELFVEYQLAAKKMRPDLRVAMAAYGDYGPFYIGTARAYDEGGYETGPNASNVAPEAETVLMNGIKRLLEAP